MVPRRFTATRERVASVRWHGFIMAGARSIDARDAFRLPMTAQLTTAVRRRIQKLLCRNPRLPAVAEGGGRDIVP